MAGIFGQSSAGKSHLINCGVCPGDIFLILGVLERLERIRSFNFFLEISSAYHFGYLVIDRL
jgi:hypothetical protein